VDVTLADMTTSPTVRLTDDELAAWRKRWLVRGVVLGTLAFVPGVLLGVAGTLLFFMAP